MKSHKAGISSLPVASPTLRAAGWVSQPCLFSRPHTKWAPLQRNRAFCACADIYWNLLLQHLPVKPQKSNWIFTQHCRSLYITPNPWVYVLRGNLGSHSWTAALRWWTGGDFWNQTNSWGERAGNEALDQAQVRDAEEAFLAWAEGLLERCGQGADKSKKGFLGVRSWRRWYCPLGRNLWL